MTTTPTTARVRCLYEAGDRLGEGPLWHEGRLYWVDILGRRVHALDPDSGRHESWPMPERIGFLVQTTRGDFIAGLGRGLARVNLAAARVTALGTPEPGLPHNRFNDAKCDAAGRLWAGTMDTGARAATGWLYRYTGDEGFRAMDGPYVVTNGPAMFPATAGAGAAAGAPAGATGPAVLYHTDTVQGIVYAFDLGADGELARKREFLRLPAEDGHPDGMTTDAAGHLWVCRYGGWGLDRYRPDGSRVERIRLPVSNVTSCAFGGPRLDRLFVTTARDGLDEAALAAQPLAGALFEVTDPGVCGLPAHPFAG